MKKLTFFFVLIFFSVLSQAQEYIDYKIRTNYFYAQTDEDGSLFGYADPTWHFRGKVSSGSASGSWSSYECVYLTDVSDYGAWNNGQWYTATTVERWSGTCLSNADNIYIFLEGWEEENETPCTYESSDDDHTSDTDYDTDISGSHTRGSWTSFQKDDGSDDYVDCGTQGSDGDYRVEFDVWWNWSIPVDPEFSIANTASSSFTINLTSKNNYRVTDWDYQVSTNAAFSNIVASANETELSSDVSGLDVNTTYYIRIKGGNEAGTGDWTALQTVTTSIGELTWDGSEDNNWHTAGNWDGNVVPDENYNVTIPAGLTNYPTLASAAVCNNFLIESNSTGTGSIIGQGNLTVNGTVTVERYLSGNAWHLVSSPAPGQTIISFMEANNSIPTKEVEGVEVRGMMEYVETINNWSNFIPATGISGNFSGGRAFSIRTDTDTSLIFTGSLATGTISPVLANSDVYSWNCVGNPYPSAINMNETADYTNNFLTANAGNLNSSYTSFYVWEQSSDAYTIVNQASDSYFATLGQAFMVKLNTGVTQVQFTTDMQIHQPGETLKSEEIPWTEIQLSAKMKGMNRNTTVKFNDAMTSGLDVGYDAGAFKTGFDIYTQLLEDNGVDFGLQCLPETGLEEYEIPVGIDVTTEGEISFSLKSENLSEGIIPILNDKETGISFIFSSEEDVYTTSISESTGYGRFTLTFSSTTDVDDILSGEAHFKAWYSNGSIYILGEMDGMGEATVYDINGRKVAIHQLSNSARNQIDAPAGANSMYLVRISDSKRSEVLKVPVVGR